MKLGRHNAFVHVLLMKRLLARQQPLHTTIWSLQQMCRAETMKVFCPCGKSIHFQCLGLDGCSDHVAETFR